MAAKLITSMDQVPVTFGMRMACLLTGLSRATITNMINAGNFPGYRAGLAWKVDKEDYIQWVRQQKKVTQKWQAQ